MDVVFEVSARAVIQQTLPVARNQPRQPRTTAGHSSARRDYDVDGTRALDVPGSLPKQTRDRGCHYCPFHVQSAACVLWAAAEVLTTPRNSGRRAGTARPQRLQSTFLYGLAATR